MMNLTDPNTGNKATDRFLEANNIQLHYIHHKGLEPPLILMPGLTANAHSFDAILNAGMRRAVLAVDLRGRGLSDKPAHGYSMEDHAADIIGMLDRLGIESTVIGGHSFGGLLSIYLASHYPHRVEKIIIIDAEARMHPDTAGMARFALSRLGTQWLSFSDYLEEIKSAPYLKDKWLPEMEPYYRAGVVKKTDDGSYTTNSSPEHIIEAFQGAIGAGIDWLEHSGRVTQPAILINAVENFSNDAPILPQVLAMETVDRLEACQYIAVPGNHLTMLYGEGAREIAKAIDAFSAKPTQSAATPLNS